MDCLRKNTTRKGNGQAAAEIFSSAGDAEAVIGKGGVGREILAAVPVQAGGMAHVDQIGAGAAQLFGQFEGFGDGLVCVVRGVTQPVHDERPDALQQGQLVRRQCFHVRDIGYRSYAESENRQTAVHDAQRQDSGIADAELLVRPDAVQADLRDTGIFVLRKAVGDAFFQMCGTEVFGVDIHIAEDAQGAEVVQSAYVVVVLVCDKHGIDGLEVEREHLLPEIRSAVYQDALPAVALYQCRGPQPPVVRVIGGADGASASHLRDTGARSGS